MNRTGRSHATVLGASMAGLLAARVLADHYDRVIVVDRDPMPRSSRPRPGVPHGRHLHGLHPRGLQILEELFGGISDELVTAGAVTADVLADSRFLLSGHRFRQAPSGLRGVLCSRPFLEGVVRARVRALPQVRFLHAAITGLTSSADRERITGVRIAPSRCPERTVETDLVVDATGRGSRTPRWLAELGYQRPSEDRVEIGLGYATRTFRLRPGALGGDVLVINGGTPAHPRSGVLAVQEGGRHIVTLSGILGDHPPTDRAGFVDFARSLAFPDIADALTGAEALDDGVAFRFPASVRRRYERLAEFPARLLVAGDAVCSFNPVYGQGMTVAALEADLLRQQLAGDPVPDARRWFRAVARVVDAPWQVAVGADLAYPEVAGRRTAQIRMVNSYLPQLHAGARVDPALGLAFVRVLGLLDRPESLLRPDRMLRVALARLRPVPPTGPARAASTPSDARPAPPVPQRATG
jgi:2-polyprenyl-6-methoxyphenol hydroxylase-like FAD-dependent oxidoreductase